MADYCAAADEYLCEPCFEFAVEMEEEKKMRAYVVMGNDYPSAVFASEEAADCYIAKKKEEPESKYSSGDPRIYWRLYDFEMQS